MTEACGLVVRHCFTPYDEGGLGLVRPGVDRRGGQHRVAARHRGATGSPWSVGSAARCGCGDGSLVDSLRYDLLAEETATGS